ncbi:MAG: EamA family transporter [Candidatus Omnitrophica bacterium]|nr:EamA family transporter [Candidatus Omnitrophota bacterium]
MKMFLLLILTAFMWGFTPILEKVGLTKTQPLTAVTIRSIAVCLVLLVFLFFTGRLKEVISVDTKTIAIFSISGIIAGLLGMLTYFQALKLGATSEIVPIVATYPLVTAILSVLILGEQITILRILGTILIVAGIWLVQL